MLLHSQKFWLKLRQGSSNFSKMDWNDALSTVSVLKIEGHANTFETPSGLPKDPSGVQQVVISMSDNKFSEIFLKDHVEFTDQLKNARKRSADDNE
ncbi:hypothetical protein K457DRAFT_21671 [Linnemannia elongata AG-77]|uniref:Uncharacterized protein n=1 Tax=Linnemannia elongata AG-77 TaxID=1314771 RepID=A0A197JRT5_9FUNG|nr:hypothetical protein K457DRAFT_21671 [Linnemannia elongata AG-77]